MKALLLVGDLVGIVILAQAATLGFLPKQATSVFAGRHHATQHLQASTFELCGLGLGLVQRAAHR
jgi:hypothetical protein